MSNIKTDSKEFKVIEKIRGYMEKKNERKMRIKNKRRCLRQIEIGERILGFPALLLNFLKILFDYLLQ